MAKSPPCYTLMMRFENWLKQSTTLLTNYGVTSARLDCLIIAEEFLRRDRTFLLAHPEIECEGPALSDMDEAVARRSKHEPLAYIIGHSEFYGRAFSVTKDTLQPRTESESMISLLVGIPNTNDLTIIDIGTGTGCLAITAKLEVPSATVLATDISASALVVAEKNASNLRMEVSFYEGNLLAPLPASAFHLPTAILANLPYVPSKYPVNDAATYEPGLALFGGDDGLDLYRKLFEQIHSSTVSYIITESLEQQHTALTKIAKSRGYRLVRSEGLAQLYRTA